MSRLRPYMAVALVVEVLVGFMFLMALCGRGAGS